VGGRMLCITEVTHAFVGSARYEALHNMALASSNKTIPSTCPHLFRNGVPCAYQSSWHSLETTALVCERCVCC